MNTGMNLEELARELTRRTDPNVRRDFVTPQGKIEMVPGSEGGVKLAGLPLQAHAAIRPHAHGQIADELGIPKKYYDRMLVEKPELLARNVNTWLHAAPTAKRMVRTLDGEARAVLSSSYRPLDNHDLAQAALPILATRKAQVVSSALTETRM